MLIDFDDSKQNKSSCELFVEYLEKENKGSQEQEKEYFFDQDRDDITEEEIKVAIDRNNRKLSKDQEKYYSLHISPSKKELAHIGGDTQKLKEYTRKVMDVYAQNFNKGLRGKDLLYFAKVEYRRRFKNKDIEVINGHALQGELKKGNQAHVHVIVSRRAKDNGPKLSPKENAKGGSHFKLPDGTTIKRGFDRVAFKEAAEKIFDTFFDYDRPEEESYEYRRLRKHHPLKFAEKYGKENFFLSVQSTWYNTKAANEVYVQDRINEAVITTHTKEEFEGYLRQRGIRLVKGKIVYEKNTFRLDDMVKKLKKETIDIVGLYYLTKRFKKAVRKAKEQEREADEN